MLPLVFALGFIALALGHAQERRAQT